MLMKAHPEIEIKVKIQAQGKYCYFCQWQLYMGIGYCTIFKKSLKTSKKSGMQYTFRCKKCLAAQK